MCSENEVIPRRTVCLCTIIKRDSREQFWTIITLCKYLNYYLNSTLFGDINKQWIHFIWSTKTSSQSSNPLRTFDNIKQPPDSLGSSKITGSTTFYFGAGWGLFSRVGWLGFYFGGQWLYFLQCLLSLRLLSIFYDTLRGMASFSFVKHTNWDSETEMVFSEPHATKTNHGHDWRSEVEWGQKEGGKEELEGLNQSL